MTSTTNNTSTIDSGIAGSPIHESATNTTSAESGTSTRATAPAAPTSPIVSQPPTGHEFPGAYPDEENLGAAAEQTIVNAASKVKENLPTQEELRNAANAAREYLPSQEDLKNATRSAIDTARQYLPESVAAYLPVASSDQHSASQSGEASADVGVSSPGESADKSRNNEESVVQKKKFPFIKSDANVASGVGGTGGPGGLGTLSWAGSETSLAKLPAERSENPSGTASPAPLSAAETVSPAKVTHGNAATAYPEMEAHPSSESGSGPALDKDLPPQPSQAPGTMSHLGQNGNGDGASGKNPTLKDRLKGEVKILAGKLGGDQERVAEGRRMMGKE